MSARSTSPGAVASGPDVLRPEVFRSRACVTITEAELMLRRDKTRA
jgi:hypothetical protein